jgi:hypothetical protein
MWAKLSMILEVIKGFLSALRAYFPPKTPEEKSEDASKAVDDAIAKEQKTGRPE